MVKLELNENFGNIQIRLTTGRRRKQTTISRDFFDMLDINIGNSSGFSHILKEKIAELFYPLQPDFKLIDDWVNDLQEFISQHGIVGLRSELPLPKEYQELFNF